MRFMVLLLGVAGIGAGALFGRVGLQAGGSALQLSQWRLSIAALLLVAAGLAVRGDEERVTRRDGAWLVLAGFCLSLHFVTWLASLESISVARSTLLVSTTPLWAGLVGLLVPSLKPGRRFWPGLLLAACGMFLFNVAALKSAGTPKVPSWQGDLLAVAGAWCVLPYLLISQRLQARFGTVRTVTWIYASAALFLWLGAGFAGQGTPPVAPGFWLAVVGMALCPQLVGHTSLNWALKHFSAGQVATATLGESVFAGALAWPLFGERLGALQIVGGAVLLGGVGLALQSSKSPEPVESG